MYYTPHNPHWLDTKPEPAYPCWSCRKPVTLNQRGDADGECPYCRAELDLEMWPLETAGTNKHDH